MVSSMGRKKIVFVALDERPCNYYFPEFLFKESKIALVNVPKCIMGDNKTPADYLKLKEFLINETKDADGLIISIDTLVYGGIVPSRIHYLDKVELLHRLEVLKTIKKNNPKLLIFAFNLIMRCPQYSLSVEEPDYYDECGLEIFRKGYLTHKEKLKIITETERAQLENIFIKPVYLEDYLRRRNLNLNLNLEVLDLVRAGILDFLIYPQDDAAEYGYTAMDQEIIRSKIHKEKLHLQVLMYPGADEVGLVLLSRIQNYFLNRKPKVYVKYPAITSGMVIPCLEDRYLDTSIKYQIIASGGLYVPSICDADIILIVSIPANKMVSGPNQDKPRDLSVLANYLEVFEFMKYFINEKPIMIADLTYLNGGDLELFNDLVCHNLEFKLAGYSGWNTAANSLGTVIAMGFNYLINGATLSHQEFLALRYIEDLGYCSITRNQVTNQLVNYPNCNYFDVSINLEQIENLVRKSLEDFINEYFKSINLNLVMVKLPWKRMFEVQLEVKIIKIEL